jgi:hypothetical protein
VQNQQYNLIQPYPPQQAHPQYPPAFDAGPSVLWVTFAWVMCAVLVLGAFAGAGAIVLNARADAAPGQSFPGGQSLEISVAPGDQLVVYRTSATPTALDCAIRGDTGVTPALHPLSHGDDIRSGGFTWYPAYSVVAEPGRYLLSCQGDGSAFGVGRQYAEANSRTAGALFIGSTFVGLVIGLTTTISIVTRRRAAQRNWWKTNGY